MSVALGGVFGGMFAAVALASLAWPAGPAHAATAVQGAGASFPALVYERWAQQFQREHPDVVLSYNPVGSGEGVKQVQARAVHFGGTDVPLSPEQLAAHRLVQIPMVVGGMVPVVNLPGVASQALVLDGATLAALMLGDIRQWNDARIQALNPGLRLPELPVQRVVRAEASGSTEVLTRYLGQALPGFGQRVPPSKQPTWPGTPWRAQGSDGVSALLRTKVGAIACVPFDRIAKDRLAAVRLKTANGTVAASEDSFRAAILASDMYRKGDDQASLLAQPAREAWPITATSFLLLDATPGDLARASAVSRFVYWAFMRGDELTRGTGFAALPPRVQARLAGRLLQIRTPEGGRPTLMPGEGL